MKRIAMLLLVFVIVSLPSPGISQQTPRAHVTARLPIRDVGRVGLYKIDFTADTMQRQDRVIHFEGSVEVRLISFAGLVRPVFQADEVNFNLDTGDLEIARLGHFNFGEKGTILAK
jgi:hypothetical protein